MGDHSIRRRIQVPHILKHPGVPALVALGVAVQIVLFAVGGVRFGGDTARYLGAARALLAGHWPVGKANSYLGYDFFVAAITGVGLGPTAVVIIQAAIAVIAGYCLYLLGRRFYGHRAGLLAGALYFVYVDVQRWNFFVLTDSLFASVLVIMVYLVIRADRWLWWAVALFAAGFALTLRPNGVIVPAALGLYLLYGLWRRGAYRTLFAVLGVIAVVTVLGLNFVNTMSSRQYLPQQYLKGTVIWDYPQAAVKLDGEPPDCSEGGALRQIACFITERPGYFLELGATRLAYFFGHSRPFYSWLHNVLLWVTLFPIYVLAVIGLVRRERGRWRRLLPAAVIGFQAIVAMLTFVDWDGRHLMAVLPLVFLLAGGGADRVWRGIRPATQP
jgi:4-amino-4-deoxy-L-arabinose transferase-like glycosyltransferase